MVNEITEISFNDFSPLLKEIPDPPEKLFLRGNPVPEDGAALAVVGSRKCSSYGKQVCRSLIEGLRGEDVTIISGLALGIDAEAHRAALRAGLRTIAVPGSGLNDRVLYPRSNRGLAQEILNSGNTLLSEYEPNFTATTWSFPKRNRIMAGLSHAVLIIEAGERSGTLITARLATEYDRDVLAVPGSIYSANSQGPNKLIQDGATPILTPEDITDALGIPKNTPSEQHTLPTADLTETEQVIIAHLTEPRSKEGLAEQSGLSTTELNITLAGLELKGLIKDLDGKITLL